MKDPLSALDLSIPPQRKPDRNSFDIRPRAVDEWLENLPVASLGETSRALFEALSEVNRLAFRPAPRQAFLERLDGRIGYVVDGLRKHYPPREFPLPPRSRQVAALSLTLLREMAVGHFIVVQAALAGERLGRRTLALSVYRCMRYLGALLGESYGLYRPCPAGLWQTLHGLYLEAEKRGLLHLAVADPGLAHGRRGSIASAYRQILLLAAAGPYRMRQHEALDAYRLLEAWAPHAELSALDAPGAAEAMFIVPLDQDLPPQPAAGATPTGSSRTLMTAGLARLAAGRPARMRLWPWRRSAPQADPELAQRLAISLGAVPRRRFSRLPVSERSRIEAMIGLSHIARSLADETGLADPELDAGEATFVSRDVARAERRPEDVWDLIFTSERGRPQPSPASARQTRQLSAGTQHWRLLNISAGGYCLISDSSRSARAQVGELIALRELADSHPGAWRPGVVRWMKHTPGEGLQLGVQVLAPELQPVIVRPRLENGALGAASRGLLLPGIEATGQPRTLLLPCLPVYDGERALQLRCARKQSEAALSRRLESTGAFAQYEFRIREAKRSELESVFSSL